MERYATNKSTIEPTKFAVLEVTALNTRAAENFALISRPTIADNLGRMRRRGPCQEAMTIRKMP
jgi:hypothetical protein